MTAVVSKNLYELLGNTHDEDSDKEPEPPVKVVDKTPARTDKRNAPREAPAAPNNAGARRGPGGNEGAFRDRTAGSANNRTKPTEDGARTAGTYNGRGRGGQGRGGRGRGGPRDDRHSKHVGGASEKQAAHGWGGETGEAELNDEKAGAALASADEKTALAEDGNDAPVNADGRTLEEEEEDNSVSYADYLVQQAEKKLSLQAAPSRKANEGTKEDKKWAQAQELKKTEEEEFIAGSGGKAKRARERKQKEVVEIDQRFVEQPSRDSGRGGRGRGDGPRRGGERGAFRGERGAARGPRGDGATRGRGGPRGGAARGGAPRGGAAAIAIEDTKAFPSLGA